MLNVENINVSYGKVQALFDVSLQVGEDEIISIIGANGAGKTTILKTIMGLNHPTNGKIVLKGSNISVLQTHAIVRKHVVLIPEGREIFPKLSVIDNLEMGAYSCGYSKQAFKDHIDSMYELFPRLRERAKQLAGTLSGGEQQMLTIARGLMSDPQLLMLDEPSLGLAPVIVEDMFNIIVRIHEERKIPIVLVEQNAFMALSIADRGYVLENGRIVMEGPSTVLLNDPGVKSAYLGG